MKATSASVVAPRVTPERVRFGIFDVDLKTGELRKAGVRIKIQEQPFQVLAALLEDPGRLVTRDQLRARLWPDGQYLDYDHALTTAVKKLRRALNDSAGHPRYIETLPKRGYRFVAPVEQVDEAKGERTAPAPQPVAVPPIERGELRRLRGQRLALGLLAGVATVALVGLAFWVTRPEEPAPRPRPRRFSFALENPRGASPKISPDGRYIAFVAGPGRSLWIRELASEEPRRLDGVDIESSPVWAPDSESIAYRVADQIKRVSVHGGPALTICELPAGNFAGGAWHPSGDTFLFSSGLPPILRVAPADGGAPSQFIQPEVVETGGANVSPAFITGPDGSARGVIFAAGSPVSLQLVVVDLETKESRRLGPGAQPAWDPRGFVLYQSDGGAPGIWSLPFSAATLEATGPAQLIDPAGGAPSVSDEGTLVYSDANGSSGGDQLVWRDRAGEVLENIGGPQTRIRQPALSPDGRSVAVEAFEEDNNDIWIHDIETGVRTRLTHEPALESGPVWRPDGSSVAYRFDRDGNAEIFERARDRSTEARALLATSRGELPTSFMPDGQTLVYAVSDPETRYDLWMAEGSPENARALLRTPFNEVAAEVSPDGRWMAYCSDESGRYEVYVRALPVSASSRQVSEGGGCQPRWSRNGRELFYVRGASLYAVEALEQDGAFQPGSRVRLFYHNGLRTTLPYRRNYDVSGDGRRFVTVESIDEPVEEERRVRVVEHWTGLLGRGD